MPKELEVWGELKKTDFLFYLKDFENKFGKPKKIKRLSISFWDPDLSKDIDTRIRITDGEAEIMQKVGKWENEEHLDMEEISLNLPKDVEQIFNVYKILHNLYVKKYPPRLIQFESFIFDTDEYELKFAKQFGKSSRYLFEVELKGKENLREITDSLGLSDYIRKTDSEFWVKWNRDVNLDCGSLSDREIRSLITKYL